MLFCPIYTQAEAVRCAGVRLPEYDADRLLCPWGAQVEVGDEDEH